MASFLLSVFNPNSTNTRSHAAAKKTGGLFDYRLSSKKFQVLCAIYNMLFHFVFSELFIPILVFSFLFICAPFRFNHIIIINIIIAVHRHDHKNNSEIRTHIASDIAQRTSRILIAQQNFNVYFLHATCYFSSFVETAWCRQLNGVLSLTIFSSLISSTSIFFALDEKNWRDCERPHAERGKNKIMGSLTRQQKVNCYHATKFNEK